MSCEYFMCESYKKLLTVSITREWIQMDFIPRRLALEAKEDHYAIRTSKNSILITTFFRT